VVAPTAFKGTLGPEAVARAMAAGVAAAWPDAALVVRPLSDGGNGLLEAYRSLAGGQLEECLVTGPLGMPVRARWVRDGNRAVVESAEACGLHLVPEERRDPLRATTRGVGELLRAALESGAAEVVLGLGGSATVDGGTGMARALGWRFDDAAGQPLPDGGAPLAGLARIVGPARGLAARVVALCDVANPLVGRDGAARVFGPQKGASPEAVERLEAGLARLAAAIEASLGCPVAALPGSGAAGGLGAGARAFLGAELVAGAAWMMERADVAQLLRTADLLVTGEGSFDVQSGMGKITGRLVEMAAAAAVPVLLVCGRVRGSLPPGVTAAEGGGRTLTASDLAELAERACKALALGDRLRGPRH
jgi:glycerate kinase